jgi:adenine phosphoribosyltransferase
MDQGDLKATIREIPDFPKKGILFYDITTLLKDPKAFRTAVDRMGHQFRREDISKIAAIDARGFIFGACLALHLDAGLVPIRKSGKLPADVYEVTYSLEYGENALAIHKDAVAPGERTLIVDDLLATGGTASAAVDLVEQIGGSVVSVAFLVELVDLKGREKLKGCEVFSLIQY